MEKKGFQSVNLVENRDVPIQIRHIKEFTLDYANMGDSLNGYKERFLGLIKDGKAYILNSQTGDLVMVPDLVLVKKQADKSPKSIKERTYFNNDLYTYEFPASFNMKAFIKQTGIDSDNTVIGTVFKNAKAVGISAGRWNGDVSFNTMEDLAEKGEIRLSENMRSAGRIFNNSFAWGYQWDNESKKEERTLPAHVLVNGGRAKNAYYEQKFERRVKTLQEHYSTNNMITEKPDKKKVEKNTDNTSVFSFFDEQQSQRTSVLSLFNRNKKQEDLEK